ncbi:MAG TPA: response regulator transcription factor [Verrucomicrobiae bacterium]|nr:response regulator transcription factor [Verrucomicrobiae bacterium]
MAAAIENSSSKVTRVLLVDDHPVVREGLAESINRETDLTVCAQAEDHQGALRAIETTHPELIVVDLMLRDSSGMELIKDIHVRWPRLLILVVSMHDETLYAERVLRAGAQGYITKQQATHDILLAIRRVIGGGIYLNERTASAVLARLAAKPQLASHSIPDLLADRELEVFELTGRGLSTREIAGQLRIDVKTVDTYRARIREKLNLKSSSELLQLAIRWNQSRANQE